MEDVEYPVYKISETPSQQLSVSEQLANQIHEVPHEPILRMSELKESHHPVLARRGTVNGIGLQYLAPSSTDDTMTCERQPSAKEMVRNKLTEMLFLQEPESLLCREQAALRQTQPT